MDIRIYQICRSNFYIVGYTSIIPILGYPNPPLISTMHYGEIPNFSWFNKWNPLVGRYKKAANARPHRRRNVARPARPARPALPARRGKSMWCSSPGGRQHPWVEMRKSWGCQFHQGNVQFWCVFSKNIEILLSGLDRQSWFRWFHPENTVISQNS